VERLIFKNRPLNCISLSFKFKTKGCYFKRQIGKRASDILNMAGKKNNFKNSCGIKHGYIRLQRLQTA
jgi:hypothetical protein